MRASFEQIEIIKASQGLRQGQVMKIDACAGSSRMSHLEQQDERDTVLDRMRKNIRDCAASANNYKDFKNLLFMQ